MKRRTDWSVGVGLATLLLSLGVGGGSPELEFRDGKAVCQSSFRGGNLALIRLGAVLQIALALGKGKKKTQQPPQPEPSPTPPVPPTTPQPINPPPIPTQQEPPPSRPKGLGLLEEVLEFPIPAHFALIAVTRCGKSLSLKALIFGILRKTPSAQVKIIDPKNSDWMGLPSIQCFQGGEFSTFGFEQEVERLHKELGSRIEFRSGSYQEVWLVVDEYYRLISKLPKDSPTIDKLNDLAQLGLEFGIHLILVSQSHQAQDLRFNSAARKAFRFICLGRSGIWEVLESTVSDSWLIPSKSTRAKLSQQVHFLKQNRERETPIALLPNLGKAGFLPDFSWLKDFRFEFQPGEEPPDSLEPRGAFQASSPSNETQEKSLNRPNFEGSSDSGDFEFGQEFWNRFLQARQEGASKNEAIRKFFGVSPGGSKKYKNALALIEHLEKKFKP